MDLEMKKRQLTELRAQVRTLEAELASDSSGQWPPQSYYAAYHVLAGFVLGMIGAAASLVFNVVGSLLVGQHPLRLIQVYLTFPLGRAPLEPSFDNHLALAVGCCLYLATGMFLGMLFHVFLTWWYPFASFSTRLAAASVLAMGVWLVNFYGILWWLQPLLFGGNWIVEQVPWWVAALTHLVFGWTMVIVQPLGKFIPYVRSGAA